MNVEDLFIMRKLTEINKGDRFGLLTIIKEVESERYSNGQLKRRVLCKCDCGKDVIVPYKQIKTGNQKSCGCLKDKYYNSRRPQRYVEVKSGDRYGRLTIIQEVEPRTKNNGKIDRQFLCKCNCGKEITTSLSLLRTKHVSSCGCLWKRVKGNAPKPEYDPNIRKEHPRIYRIWNGIRERCFNPNCDNYYLYGARGVTVCDEWMYFENFCEWALASGYSDKLTIDRIDSNGNYEPSNCRWTTMLEQGNNRRNNTLLTLEGKTQTLSEWCREKDISVHVVVARIKLGWELYNLFLPVRKKNKH